MFPEAREEHQWLHKFLGKWRFESACSMGEGQPSLKSTGFEEYDRIGELWIIGTGQSQMPDGAPTQSKTTLGFHGPSQKFIGTFIASIMDYLWIYEGSLNESKTILSLDCKGPDFQQPDQPLVDYVDVYEFHDNFRRTLRSYRKLPDGQLVQFMEATYYKIVD